MAEKMAEKMAERMAEKMADAEKNPDTDPDSYHDLDPPTQPPPGKAVQATMYFTGFSIAAIGLLLILLAVLTKCLAMLHGIVGVLLVALGCTNLTAMLMATRSGARNGG